MKRLPYLGTEIIKKNHREVCIGNNEESKIYSNRPDYRAFKNRVYNTEIECVEVLIGFVSPNSVLNLCEDRLLKWGKEDTYHFDSALTDQRFIDTNEIISLLIKIKDIMDTGSVIGEMGAVVDKTFKDELDQARSQKELILFSRWRQYSSLDYLNWFQKNSFPIPDELKFHKNADGQLEYVDAVSYGNLQQTFPQHPNNKSLEEDPLYIAVKAREAFINNDIGLSKYKTKKQLLTKWLKDKYSDKLLSNEQRKHIVAIVNDGYGHGGNRKQ
jgi:hypothetical protein